MTKQTLHTTIAQLLEAKKTWLTFTNALNAAGWDLEEHPVNDVYDLFEEHVWNMIIKYRGYEAFECEEVVFSDMIYDVASGNEQKTVDEIIKDFVEPDWIEP